MTHLRPYQVRAIEDTRKAFAEGNKRVVLVSPTGSGKTVIGIEIIKQALARGRRCLWIAHRRELVYQAARRMTQDVAILMSGERVEAHDITVASVQTIVARGITALPPADLVVLDECHHAVAESFAIVLAQYADAWVLGLTATPERADKVGLWNSFEALVNGPKMSELVNDGHLVPSRVIAPNTSRDWLAQDTVGSWLQWAKDKRGFIFSRSVDASQAVTRGLHAHGIRVAHISAETPKKERDKIINEFRNGETDVLCNVDVLTEGFDAPEAEACLVARKMGHRSTWLQTVGRVLRPDGRKTHGLIIDPTGNVHRHGLPEADRTWTLEGGRLRASDDAPIYVCRACGSAYRASAAKCPFCGEPRQMEEPVKKEHSVVPALMAEVRPLLPNATRDRKRATLERLRRIARKRGYRPGWVYYKYKATYGEAP